MRVPHFQYTVPIVFGLVYCWLRYYEIRRALPSGSALDEVLITPDGMAPIARKALEKLWQLNAMAVLTGMPIAINAYEDFKRGSIPANYGKLIFGLNCVFCIWVGGWVFLMGRAGERIALRQFAPQVTWSIGNIVLWIGAVSCVAVATAAFLMFVVFPE